MDGFRVIAGIAMTVVGAAVFLKRDALAELDMTLNRMILGRPLGGPSGVFAKTAMLVLGVVGVVGGLSILWGGLFCGKACG